MVIEIFRTLIIYFLLFIAMRLMGKRQLGEMELSEFIIAALIADLAAHPLQDIGIPLINGIVPVLVLFCCEVIISGVSMKSVRLRSLLFGRPSILIMRGVINQSELKRNRFTLDELTQELRSKNILDISTVEYAILETDGTLTVIQFPEKLPVTAGQMNIPVTDGGYPILVINDGRILSANLKHAGHDERWLNGELKKRGVSAASDVFIMSVDSAGNIYYAEKELNK